MAFAIAAAILAARSAPAQPAAPSSLIFEEVLLIPTLGADFTPALTLGRDGNIYGTTPGTVFRIDGRGIPTTVHTFSSEGFPARLVVGQDGLLYGFTGQHNWNDPWASHGVFFRLDYRFRYTELLSLPYTIATDLVVGSDGAFYAGTAYLCGGETCGDSPGLIKITSAGGYALLGGTAPETLWSPVPLLVGSDGAIYGTRDEARSGRRSLFRLDTVGNLTLIHTLTNTEGAIGNLSLGIDGLIYGTSPYGGTGNGTLVRFDNTGSVTLFHQFSPLTDGRYPTGSLTLGVDGALYGVSKHGGPAEAGTVYRVDTAGTLTLVHAFNYTDGGEPEQGLLLARDGALYGVTPIPSGAFRVGTSGTVTYPGIIGDHIPTSPLVQGNDRAFYGIASRWDPAVGYQPFVYRLLSPPACDDGVDNDGDQLVDFPADPGCVSQNDNDETTPPPTGGCGLGPELAPAMLLLLVGRRRSRFAA